jgi:hypothetical protein
MLDARGARIPVTAYIGVAIWSEFHVDLVGSDHRMTGTPEDVPALAKVTMPNLEQRGYRAYPLVDHVADKIAAMLELHGRTNTPSIRFKDLVDLVAIVTHASLPASQQIAALESEARRRGLSLPGRSTVPDRDLWERGYAAEARRSLPSAARTLSEALEIVTPFIDPLLDESAAGTWKPDARRWSG